MFSKLLMKWWKWDTSLFNEEEWERLMAKRSENQSLFNLETPALSACGHAQAGKPQGPVECLGMTFENDEARREHFLCLLREGLEELYAKLGGVPFTMVEDAYARMRSVEVSPWGLLMCACLENESGHGVHRPDLRHRLQNLAARAGMAGAQGGKTRHLFFGTSNERSTAVPVTTRYRGERS